MEALTKIFNSFKGGETSNSPKSIPDLIVATKRRLTFTLLSGSDKDHILNTLEKAEIAYSKGMIPSSEKLLSQAVRDINKAVKKRKSYSENAR